MKYNKIFTISFLVSLLIHYGVLFFPPELVLNIELTKKEKTNIKKIDRKLKQINEKQVIPKKLLKEISKVKSNIKKTKKTDIAHYEAKSKYSKLIKELSKYSRYSELDKKLVTNHLSKEKQSIKNTAIKRAYQKSLGTDKFYGFIPKKISKTEKMSTSKIKINFLDNKGSQKSTNENSSKKCNPKNVYYGIGVGFFSKDNSIDNRYAQGFWKITHIAEGYSADNYDIKEGDILLGAFDPNGTFHEGTGFIKDNKKFIGRKMRILINRNGKALEKNIPINKVCYSIEQALNSKK